VLQAAESWTTLGPEQVKNLFHFLRPFDGLVAAQNTSTIVNQTAVGLMIDE